jgi:hypothetical protein
MLNLPGDPGTVRRILGYKDKESVLRPAGNTIIKSGSDPAPPEASPPFRKGLHYRKNPAHMSVNGVFSFIRLMAATPRLTVILFFPSFQHGYNRSILFIQ